MHGRSSDIRSYCVLDKLQKLDLCELKVQGMRIAVNEQTVFERVSSSHSASCRILISRKVE